jgi:hypothetical protein
VIVLVFLSLLVIKWLHFRDKNHHDVVIYVYKYRTDTSDHDMWITEYSCEEEERNPLDQHGPDKKDETCYSWLRLIEALAAVSLFWKGIRILVDYIIWLVRGDYKLNKCLRGRKVNNQSICYLFQCCKL